MTVAHNISRLRHLINRYQLSDEEFLQLVNEGRKKEIKKEQIFGKEIDVNHLKKIDKIFNKGLAFYVDPQEPIVTENTSIFFRKKTFNSELNLKARQIVNEFEELKLSLSAIASLSEIETKRSFKIYTVKDDVKKIASSLREKLYPSFVQAQKEFLKALINKLAIYDILVLEFVETWNQKDRANIDGVFLSPNVIVLKRQEGSSYRREIFTLMHEFAHYLLNVEEVEKLDYKVLANRNNSKIEQWCNEFAFYFLVGNYENLFHKLQYASPDNDYNHDAIKNISTNTHLSKRALYTRLLFDKKIDYSDYLKIIDEFDRDDEEYYEKQRRKREEDKEKGIEGKGSAPKPIKSNLLISTIQTAFNEGVIDEYEVCKTLKIPPEKIGNYIY